ncbi:MAG: NusG domain II-containing protein [Oscillospiraceae bacterium]
MLAICVLKLYTIIVFLCSEIVADQTQMIEMAHYNMKKRDIIIIATVLCLALISLPLVRYITAQRSQNQQRTVIYVDDKVYKTVPLGKDEIIKVQQENGGFNEIHITVEGEVFMASANCKNQDCVKQGAMNCENMETRAMRNWIICLPNRISIELQVDTAK